jgi:hypothetical protein
MAQVTGTSTYWNTPNYDGLLWTADVTPGRGTGTPFLSIIGGLNGNNAIRRAGDFDYAMSAEYDFPAAAQPAITETASLTAPSAVSPVLAQARNTAQIYQEAVDISYKKLSTTARVASDIDKNPGGYWAEDGSKNQQNLVDKHTMYALQKIARDANYTFLNGVFVQSTSSAVAAKTRGVITGVTTSATAAAGATLSKALLQTLFRDVVEASGGQAYQQMPMLFVSAFQKQQISDLYGYQPDDWTVGGLNIQTVLTDFGRVGVVYDPMVPADTVLLAATAAIRPVFVDVPGKGNIFFEDLAKTGAASKGQIYGQMGIDYANEQLHGKITGLATS